MVDMIAFGKIENFSEGWGVVSYNTEKSHFWKRDAFPSLTSARRAYSKCGLANHISDTFPMLNAGSFPHCKKCKQIEGVK